MHDSELKKILSETCPVLPGQEDRAWKALQQKLYGSTPLRSALWQHAFTWRVAGGAFALGCVLTFLGISALNRLQPVSFASAASEAPGIYATSFYSHSAKAQVVWLNGLAPAMDKPTYLDPTTKLTPANKPDKSASDPNSL